MKKKITMILTCVGGRLIFDIIKAFRDADDYNLNIVGVDLNKDAHGRLLCDNFYLVPPAEKEPKKWISEILKIADRENVDLIIPLSDGESIQISENLKLFDKKKIKTSANNLNFIKLISDKYLMMSFLKKNKVNSGTFSKVDDISDVRTLLEEYNYPKKKFVLKPRYGRGSRGVLICDNSKLSFETLLEDRFCGSGSFEQIDKKLMRLNYRLDNYLMMPFYENIICDVDCLSKNGKQVDIAIRERQLKNPLMPTSTGHKIRMDNDIKDYVRSLCKIFKINGPSDFDIVKDDNGNPILLDAGSRFSGSVGGSFTAGKNMLSQLIRVLFDLPLKTTEIRDGCVLRPYITMAEIPKKNEKDFL